MDVAEEAEINRVVRMALVNREGLKLWLERS